MKTLSGAGTWRETLRWVKFVMGAEEPASTIPSLEGSWLPTRTNNRIERRFSVSGTPLYSFKNLVMLYWGSRSVRRVGLVVTNDDPWSWRRMKMRRLGDSDKLSLRLPSSGIHRSRTGTHQTQLACLLLFSGRLWVAFQSILLSLALSNLSISIQQKERKEENLRCQSALCQ